MSFNILFGILLIATGAFSAGSFAVRFRKIRGWQWETYWMAYSLGAYIIMPLLACLIFAPGLVFNTVHNILPDVPPENIVSMYEAVTDFNNN